MNYELERICKEAMVVCLRHYLVVCMEKLK
jgi:hypothetical protein